MTNETQTPPQTPEERLRELEAALLELVGLSVLTMRQINPKMDPTSAAAEVFRFAAMALDDMMPPGPVVSGMMIAFEGRHAQPMSFIDIDKAKKALVVIAAARRKVEALRGGIILPNAG